MRIVHLTPGTGNFHCGSCLRDNQLIKELRRRGHDVVMVPLYLPLVTDDEPASPDIPVFLGGVNLFLQEKIPLFRHTPRWIDRLLDTAPLLKFAADRATMTTAEQLGEMTLGSFSAADGRQAKAWRELVEWIGSQDPKPELVSLSNGLLVGIAKTLRSKFDIPVVSSLQGEDAFLDSLPGSHSDRAWEAFRENGKHVSRFIAVSDYYAAGMRERLRVPEDAVATVRNGIDLTPFSAPDVAPPRPTIGYLARLHHEKGLHTLVDAFIELRKRGNVPDARLRIAGSKIASDDRFITEQETKLHGAGLVEDVEIMPNIDFEEKVAFLQSLSVFSVPATYGEAFGLFVLEALACGVPVVQPRHGAFPEVLGQSGGGVLCEPDDPLSLAVELEGLLTDERKRRDLGNEGRSGVARAFGVGRMAEDFERVCQEVLAVA